MPLEEEFNNMIVDMRDDIKKRIAEKFVEYLKENIRFYDLIASETLINSIEIDMTIMLLLIVLMHRILNMVFHQRKHQLKKLLRGLQ